MGVIGGKAVKGAGKFTRFVASKLKTKLAEKRLGKGAGKAAEKMAAEGFNKAPYNPQSMREMLQKNNPGAKIESSTLPNSKLKNVKLAGQRHPETGIVFDQRGFPIFDKVAKVDTRIGRELSCLEKPNLHKREATRNLRDLIDRGGMDPSGFNGEQLIAIQKGKETIPGFIWHHHQDTGRMQLIPEKIHGMVGHIGGMSMWPFK
jgi:filamentous hemagglutinin